MNTESRARELLLDQFNEAIAWGATYGSAIPRSQWNEMRSKQAALFVERSFASLLSDATEAQYLDPLPPCGDEECTCHKPTFTEPMEALRFLSGRFKYAGVDRGVALSYARDIDQILERDTPSRDVAGDKPVAWQKKKPTQPGAYWVRGFNLANEPDEQYEAVVDVREHNGDLWCNLHQENSNERIEKDWFLLSDLDDTFEWNGPLYASPPNAGTDAARKFAEKFNAATPVFGAPFKLKVAAAPTDPPELIKEMLEAALKEIDFYTALIREMAPEGIEEGCDECGGDKQRCKELHPDCPYPAARFIAEGGKPGALLQILKDAAARDDGAGQDARQIPLEPSYDMLRAGCAIDVNVEGEDEGGDFLIGGRLQHDDARQLWKAMYAVALREGDANG